MEKNLNNTVNKMENKPRAKKLRKLLSQVPAKPEISEEEKQKFIQQSKDLANLKFYAEQEYKQKIKTKIADANQLNRLLTEHLSCYYLCGFDVVGEPLIMRVSEKEVDRRALDDLLRDQFIKFQIRKSQEMQGDF